jgi:hypothetical protein
VVDEPTESETPPGLRMGSRFGRYRLIELLGRGGPIRTLPLFLCAGWRRTQEAFARRAADHTDTELAAKLYVRITRNSEYLHIYRFFTRPIHLLNS